MRCADRGLRALWTVGLLLVLLGTGTGCTFTPGGGCDKYACETCPDGVDCSLEGTALVFEVRTRDAGFFEYPWPSDTRLTEDGSLDLSGFPNPANASMLTDYLATIQEYTTGFGTNAAVFMSFDGTLARSSLPVDPAQTLTSRSGVFLMDVSDGPGRGERIPLAVRYFSSERQFTPANTLVLRPVLGFPLRENTRYAAVVTSDVTAQEGKPLGASADFERTKYDSPPAGENLLAWWTLMHPVYADLEELADLDRKDVIALAVFTTQDVHGEMDGAAALIDEQPAPTAGSWREVAGKSDLYLYDASFEMPEFQMGEKPNFEGGGAFVFDRNNYPIVQRTAQVPFFLAVPKGTAPTSGWPLVIYAHGTGGSRRSFFSYDVDVADYLAQRGIASISIDQPLHGDRNPEGWNEDYVTFNPYNIVAMRDNFRQGATDLLVLRRLLRQLEVPAAVSNTGVAVRFDDDRVGYMGHSQGSLNGALFMSLAQDVRGAVFSGSGGGLGPAILGKTEPVDIPALIIFAMGLEEDEFDLDHPLVAAFQTFAERSDPINFTRRMIAAPPPGVAPKHLFFSQGLLDAYALPEQAAAMAASAGCSPMTPLVAPIEAFDLRGLDPMTAPITGNAIGSDGQSYTGVMVQYPNDGHFAVFDNSTARRQYLGFLESLLGDGPVTVVP